MVETYTRLIGGQLTTARRRRFGVIDHVTAYAGDDDEYNPSVYGYRLVTFPEYICRHLRLSVRADTQRLANDAALAFLGSTGLVDLATGAVYGSQYNYSRFGPVRFRDVLEARGSGCFCAPPVGSSAALIECEREAVTPMRARELIDWASHRRTG